MCKNAFAVHHHLGGKKCAPCPLPQGKENQKIKLVSPKREDRWKYAWSSFIYSINIEEGLSVPRSTLGVGIQQ